MAYADAALVTGSTAIETAITHFRLHSGARGSAGTTNAIGSLTAVNGSVDGDGDVTWTNIAFTGLPASGAVAEVSYWASGTYYGGSAVSGDATANSAGEYTLDSVTENAVGT